MSPRLSLGSTASRGPSRTCACGGQGAPPRPPAEGARAFETRPLTGCGAERWDLARFSSDRPPAASMADSLLLLKRVPSRHTWLRARKARPQLILSRRPRRRLRNLRWRSRRRLRRRLLQAQAAGGDWLQGGCLVSGAAALQRLKTSARRRASSPEPAEDPIPSGPTILPIPPVRPAGSGRAVLLLPLGQVGLAGGAGRAAPGAAGWERPLSPCGYSGRGSGAFLGRWCWTEGTKYPPEGILGLWGCCCC